MDIKDKILALVPDAVITTKGTEIIEIPKEKFREVALQLRDDRETALDYLFQLIGMDWKDKLGVIYQLKSSKFPHSVVLKVATDDIENPILPSVSDIWTTANFNEREVYDFFGIKFSGHPDMRRIFLRHDWVGYPLRKDFEKDRIKNPVRMTNEETIDTTESYELAADGTIIGKEGEIFDDKEYVVNIGPQHPATHGVLRLRVSLQGEIVQKIDVNCGYIHRGIEKLCEQSTYPQTLAFTDRLDYLGAHQNRHALCMCIEKGLGIEVSDRVKYIRTIMDELQRIDSHLLYYSCLCMDMGALTAFFYGFRDREKILDIFEKTTGGRLIQNYNTIGGVQADLHPNFQKDVKTFLADLRSLLPEYHNIFTGNVIAQSRLKNVGIISKERVISYAASGPNGRASGWDYDVRKDTPYAAYDKVNFKKAVYQNGDSFDRYMVRMDEIVESMSIVEQLIDNIPEGNIQEKIKPIVRIPEGSYFASVEASRGEFGVYLESTGDKSPYRIKFRSTGFPLVSLLDEICTGGKIADLIAIGGTLDYVIPDIDR